MYGCTINNGYACYIRYDIRFTKFLKLAKLDHTTCYGEKVAITVCRVLLDAVHSCLSYLHTLSWFIYSSLKLFCLGTGSDLIVSVNGVVEML